MMSSLTRRLALVLLLSPAVFAAHAQTSDLLISEYVEGSGTNKAVEIYNGTGAAVDLNAGKYRLELYSNGSAGITNSLALTATIADGDVLVLCNATDAGITDECDVTNSGTINFNGDDALVLRKNSASAGSGDVVDSLGQVGFDPGSEWGSGNQSTADNTIRRKDAVCAGDTDPSDAFDPSTEWDGFANGTYDGLGSHSSACGGGDGTPVVSFGSASAAEGDSGTKPFFFTISSNVAPATDLVIGYATQDGTATTEDDDYIAKSGNATIAAGTTSVTISVDVNGDTDTEPNETFKVVVTNAGGAVIANGTGIGTINNDDVTVVPIHDIQGNGSASPVVGQIVTTRGIVTGRKSNGFFMQAADADADADPATSEGVFVFTGSAPPAEAAIGNLVQVSATVSEFSPTQDPLQPPLTELGSATVTLLSTGNALPTPVPLTATFPDPEGAYDQLERVEGMRVSAASLTVVGPTDGSTNETNATGSSNGVFYATVTGDPRPFRTPGIQAPDPAPSGSIPPIPRWDTSPETMEVDSDAIGGAKLDLAAGAVVTGVTGPMDYGFRRYTILPEATPTVADTGEVVTAARLPGEDEFTVASYNLERFFDTANDPNTGEPVLTPTAFANRLNKASLGIRDELHAPDVLAVMEMENLSTLQQLADKINADAVAASQPDPQYAAYLEEGNDVGGIDVGFLVKAAPVDGTTPRVEVVDVTQFGKDTTWIDPSDNQPSLLNDRPPLLLRAIVHYADGRSFPISLFAVHQRSLNGISDESASGSTTAGDRVRRKRQAQAEYLANLIQDRETADPTEHLVVLGDFNAFDFNDGYVDPMGVVTGLPTPDDETVVPGDGADLVDPDLMNLHYLPEADQRYSYVFDGQAQSLDHILINQALGADVADFTLDHARMNADFPETNRNDPDSPSRLSDHDPAIAYFALQQEERADLSVTAAAGDSTVAGQPAHFVALVANNGPDAATNAGLGFAFDQALPDLHATLLPAGWTCDAAQVSGNTTTLACNASSVAANAVALQFTLEATAAAATVPGTITMAVAIDAETQDPDPENNQYEDTMDVLAPAPQADLSIDLDRTGLATGSVANFRAQVANEGPDAATNVHVTITADISASPILAQPSGWSCQRILGGSLHIECIRTAAMPSGRSEAITFSAIVQRKQTLNFQAVVASDNQDPDTDNNTDGYSNAP
jgi:predicted extracellular nuclease